MKTKRHHQWKRAAVFAAIVLASTATLAKGETPPDADALKARVEARWKALSAHDFKAAYALETPTYRKVFPYNLYLNKFAVGAISTFKDIDNVEYDAQRKVASVIVDLDTKTTRKAAESWIKKMLVPARVREKWLRIDGHWYHVNSD